MHTMISAFFPDRQLIKPLGRAIDFSPYVVIRLIDVDPASIS
jgi:hypothetical protein